MKKTTTNTTTAENLYEVAERAVYIALRARHEKSGLQFLAELQNAWSNDKRTRHADEIAEQIADTERTLDEYRQDLEFYTARANRLTLSDIDRRTAFAIAEEIRAEIKRNGEHLANLYKAFNTSYSDRADLVQIAVEQLLINERNPAPITAKVLASYGVETADELTEDERTEAQNRANFRAIINAVGRGIGTLATPEALNRTTTKAEKITPEEANNYRTIYGSIGKDIHIPHTTKRTRASDCYITIEERNTKTQKGWYKVYHYKTVAPYQYIDTYTEDENGETDIAYLKSYNPFISNEGDLERLESLAERASLTERERIFLRAFAERCRYDGDFKSVKAYAFKVLGISNPDTQRQFFKRMKDKLRTK